MRTRYDTVLLPFISIVQCPGRPVMPFSDCHCLKNCGRVTGSGLPLPDVACSADVQSRRSLSNMSMSARCTFQTMEPVPGSTGRAAQFDGSIQIIPACFEQCQVVVSIVESISPKTPAHMVRNLTSSMCDSSPQSICRAERNPEPRALKMIGHGWS